MKLCHIFTSSQSAYFFMSGQFDYLIKNGFTITILIPNDGFAEKVRNKYPSCDVQLIPIVRKISPLRDFITLISIIYKIINIKPNIIHLHTPKAGLLGGLASRILFKKNIVFHLHGLVSVHGNKIKKGLTLYFEKLSLSLSSKVIAVSPSLMDFCIENNLVKRNKIEVLNFGTINGIDYINKFNKNNYQDEVYSLKSSLDLQNKFILGFLGRVNTDKGILDLVKVYRKLSTEYSNIALCIVGFNEMDTSIIDLFNNENVSNVRIIDRVENPEIFLKLFDVQVFPSVREGFGLVLAEASAIGTPSVAYDIFGIKDAVIDGKTGTLVPFGDVTAVVNAVQKYMNSPELLNEHSKQGIDYIKNNFSQKDIWNAQKEFYLRLLNKC